MAKTIDEDRTDNERECVIPKELTENDLTEKEKVKRCLAYILSIVAYLIWCHYYTSDTVGAWVADRWELLLLGSGLLTAVAASTKGKGDDTVISAALNILSERFGPMGLRR